MSLFQFHFIRPISKTISKVSKKKLKKAKIWPSLGFELRPPTPERAPVLTHPRFIFSKIKITVFEVMKLGLQKADITGYPIIIYLFKDLLLVYNY
jgi:hypothetical protein